MPPQFPAKTGAKQIGQIPERSSSLLLITPTLGLLPNVFLGDRLRKWKLERERHVRIASRQQAQKWGGGSSPGNS